MGYEEGMTASGASQRPSYPSGWLRTQVTKSAATLNGLPPEVRKSMAHRTMSRQQPSQTQTTKAQA
jgi:hypothetical protein